MSFKDIKGQDNAVKFLKGSIGSGKISHAYIFIGPSGVGKKLAAVNFAKAVNCLDPKDSDACGVCAQCRKIDASNHPDVSIISPQDEDSSFGIDKVRAVIKDIGLKPFEGRKKVYILDGADSMTQEAQNALLKTMEEPPLSAILILIAQNINAVFSTIQSRAKKVKFFPLTEKEIRAILKDNYKLDNGKAEVLSRISSGELGKALKYNAAGFFERRRRIIDGLTDGTFLDSDFDGLSRSELKLGLDVLLTWYRDILITKAGVAADSAVVNIDRLDLIRHEAKRADLDKLNETINQIILTYSFLDDNINPKLAMAVLGINLAHAIGR